GPLRSYPGDVEPARQAPRPALLHRAGAGEEREARGSRCLSLGRLQRISQSRQPPDVRERHPGAVRAPRRQRRGFPGGVEVIRGRAKDARRRGPRAALQHLGRSRHRRQRQVPHRWSRGWRLSATVAGDRRTRRTRSCTLGVCAATGSVMKAFSAAAGFGLFALSCLAVASPADDEFRNLAARFIDDLPKFSQVNATSLGDHRYDHLLDQVDDNGRSRKLNLYRRYSTDLDAIDRDQLSRANKVDAELLRAEVEANIWTIETLKEWAWNPLVYVNLAGSSLYALMARDFAPLEQRAEDAAARLEQFPRFLRQARQSLEPSRVPKIHAETAIQQNRGIHSIIDNMILPHSDQLPAELATRLDAAVATAKEALDRHQAWLEEDLLPKASGEFRIGARLFDEKLRLTLNSPLSRREIRLRAESEYVAVRNEMYAIARDIYAKTHPYTSFPDEPDDAFKQVIIRAALEEAYRDLPEPNAIVD